MSAENLGVSSDHARVVDVRYDVLERHFALKLRSPSHIGVEYGKLLRTVHALRWFTDEAFRRRTGRQLNRGEALNDLRRFIFFAHRGTVRYPHHDDQTTQAHCHTLVVNACILSTTGYLQDAIDTRRAEGHQVSDEAITHLSPAHFEAINPQHFALLSNVRC